MSALWPSGTCWAVSYGRKAGMIVCICGIPGSGKSAILECLKARLPEWRCFRYDDYRSSGPAFAELCEGRFRWSEVGCRELEENVRTHMDMGCDILLEDPRGKASKTLGRHIDLQVCVNCRPDIAVARKALEIQNRLGSDSAVGFLSCYLAGGYRSLDVYEREIRPLSDVDVDGTDDIERNVSRIVEVCSRRQPRLTTAST